MDRPRETIRVDAAGARNRAAVLRHLHLAQLVVLVVGALAAAGVVLILSNAFIEGEHRQLELAEHQRNLVDARSAVHGLANRSLRSRLTGDARPTLRDAVVAASVAALLHSVPDHAAGHAHGDESRHAPAPEAAGHAPAPEAAGHAPVPETAERSTVPETAERSQVLVSVKRLNELYARWARQGDSPALTSAIDAEINVLSSRIESWVDLHAERVANGGHTAHAAAKRFAAVMVGVIAAVSLGSLLLWILLDRARARARRDLRVEERRSHALAENSSDIVMVVEEGGTLVYASRAVESHVGRPPSEVEGQLLASLAHPHDAPALAGIGRDSRGSSGTSIEWRIRRGDGGWTWLESLVTDARGDPTVRGWILNSRDVGDRKLVEQQLTEQAFQDPLTGLANRALFSDRLEHALKARAQGSVAVALIDLDDFKTINDSMGHAAGDEVLTELSERLRASMREADTAARLGGDEFAVLLPGTGEHEARLILERLVGELSRPLIIEEELLGMRCSVGIATSGDGADTGELVLRNADAAMYSAKALAGSAIELFRPEMQAAAHERLALKRDLAVACERGEFHLLYQPIYDLCDETVVGFEALLRWEHPTRGAITPDTFIPLAEETGLIEEIGEWVIGSACQEARDWPGPPAPFVTVNVSAAQLGGGLAREVERALADAELTAERLVLEVTESALPADPAEAIDGLRELRGIGVSVAIDDFGTGYSSLSYLAALPVDIVKMDRCFVNGLGRNRRESDLAETILRIGAGLGLRTVAEGIETPDQAMALAELGCDLGQGYFFARPLPASAVRDLLAAETGLRAGRVGQVVAAGR